MYIRGRDDKITTSGKLCDITHESYRFNGDRIETISHSIIAFLTDCNDYHIQPYVFFAKSWLCFYIILLC